MTQQQVQRPGTAQGQKQKHKSFSRKQRITAFIIVALIVTLVIVVAQVLSNLMLIPTIWGTIASVIVGSFGALFTLFALIPLLFPLDGPQSTPTTPSQFSKSPLPSPSSDRILSQVPSETSDPFRNYLHKLSQDIEIYLDKASMLPSFDIIPLQAEATPNEVNAPEEAAMHALPMAIYAMRGINEVEAEFDNFHSAFHKYEGRVLLLGDPGAGKTITIMAFARDVVSKRLEDASHPLPIVAPIATWDAEKQPSLSEWLAGQVSLLKEKDISQTIEEGNALLLLDGLDELGGMRTDKEARQQYDPRQRFIQMIPNNNQIVITCRVKDYKEVGTQLALHGAVNLQHLDDTKIQDYLRNRHRPELWEVLKVDKELREMVRMPLLLSLFTSAFKKDQVKEAQQLRSLSRGELRDAIFEEYLKQRYEYEEAKRKAELPFTTKLPFTLEQIYDVLGIIAMEDAGWGGSQNVLALHDFVRLLGEDIAQPFVDFMCLLSILIRQNDTLRFIHLLLRDYFAFKYAQTALFDGDPQTRDSAAWALWAIPDERVVPFLIEALKDPDEYARGSAAGALGRIRDVRAIEPLRKLLSDKTPVISIYGNRICDVAATALEMIVTPEAHRIELDR
jgi:hypothetical protein